MFFVISTPHPEDPEEEEVWECPTNWIKDNILYFPNSSKKIQKKTLVLIKSRTEPSCDWSKTKIFKIVTSKDGKSKFGKYKFNSL